MSVLSLQTILLKEKENQQSLQVLKTDSQWSDNINSIFFAEVVEIYKEQR